MTIIACKDEVVTCTAGHRLFKITRDVVRGDPMHASDFEPLCPKVPSPHPAGAMGDCPTCHDPFWRYGRFGGVSIHFENGWSAP